MVESYDDGGENWDEEGGMDWEESDPNAGSQQPDFDDI